MYSYKDVLTFVEQEDVQFIRLAFFDVFGKQKNISIMPDRLEKAFIEGVSFDASAIAGFGDEVKCDLFLHPEPDTLSILPWRPSQGRVVRMYCDIRHPDGSPFNADSRLILKKAMKYAKSKGFAISFGPEMEFYLFETDEKGFPTTIPFDNAGYMDIAPEDKGENIRREICFTLIDIGVFPEASHHEEGPGQNEIDFKYSNPLAAADNTAIFKWVVKTIASRNGLYADFSPKPLLDQAGNGMHINMSIQSVDQKDYTLSFIAGILDHIKEMTLFLNPADASYNRLGGKKAPQYITWSPENRSQLIRIPAIKSGKHRLELRSPDPLCNPYIAFALLIYAGIDGIKRELTPPEPCNINLYTADDSITATLDTLPSTLQDAFSIASESEFIRSVLPEEYIKAYCK
ncbi:MAG: glutamine synthetase family protein [Eubacteriales bacterium]